MSLYRKAVIGLDVDGVILDYVGGFMAYAESRGIRTKCRPHEVVSWTTFAPAFPEMNDQELWSLIEDFSEDEAFGRLEPFANVIEIITQLVEEYPENLLVAITSAGKSDITKRLREKNLSSIPFSEIHVLPLGESKERYLAALPEGSLYVDDLMKNIDVAEKVGVKGILVRRSYNMGDDHARVAHDWNDIARNIREIIPGCTASTQALSL